MAYTLEYEQALIDELARLNAEPRHTLEEKKMSTGRTAGMVWSTETIDITAFGPDDQEKFSALVRTYAKEHGVDRRAAVEMCARRHRDAYRACLMADNATNPVAQRQLLQKWESEDALAKGGAR